MKICPVVVLQDRPDSAGESDTDSSSVGGNDHDNDENGNDGDIENNQVSYYAVFNQRANTALVPTLQRYQCATTYRYNGIVLQTVLLLMLSTIVHSEKRQKNIHVQL